MDIKKWLDRIRKSGLAMSQGAVWLGGMLGGFLLPPPAGISSDDEKIWLRLGQFILAVVLGLIYFAAQRWTQPRHAFKWCGLALLSLALAVTAFFHYQQFIISWTASYNGAKVVMGSELTAPGKAMLGENPKISGDSLLDNFAGVAENIWTRESINHRRLLLAGTYVSCLPLFTICLIAVIQAAQCGVSRPTRRKRKLSGQVGG